MKEITITKKLYNAKELNEMFPKAFEKAIMDNANNQWSCIYDWWKDDFKQLLSLVGIDLEKMYYSGFGSQGDGLCFDATFYYEPNALEKVKEYAPVDTKLFPLIETYIALQKEQEFKGKVKQSGYGCHSGCTSFDISSIDSDDGVSNWTAIVSSVKAFMDYGYEKLEEQWDAINEDEYFIGECDDLGIWFNDVGNIVEED